MCATYSLYNKELLKDKYYPHVVAYYFKEWNGFDMDVHSHNQVEIMYIIRGVCTVGVGNNTFKMKKGEFILIDAGINHKLTVKEDEPCRMLNIEFIFTKKNIPLPSIGELSDTTESIRTLISLNRDYLLLKDFDEIYPALKSLIIELDKNKTDGEFMRHLLLTQILMRIAQLSEELKEKENFSGSIYVKEAINYIHYHYDMDICVEDIARHISIHPGYLHRIFKQYTGHTIMEYLTNIRVDKAKMLLENTDIPVTDISGYVGINSVQYFTYIFKKHTGFTPLQYRKAKSKDNRMVIIS